MTNKDHQDYNEYLQLVEADNFARDMYDGDTYMVYETPMTFAEWKKEQKENIPSTKLNHQDLDIELDKFIYRCKEVAYGKGTKASNELEGDFGTWEDWKESIKSLFQTTCELEKTNMLIAIANQEGWEDTAWGYAEELIGINANKFERQREKLRKEK